MSLSILSQAWICVITRYDDLRYKGMSQLKHFVCPACEQGILTVVAEVGIESEGSTGKVSIFISSARKGIQM